MLFELIHPDIDVAESGIGRLLQQKLGILRRIVFDIGDSYENASDEFELDLKPEAEYLGVTAYTTGPAGAYRVLRYGSSTHPAWPG